MVKKVFAFGTSVVVGCAAALFLLTMTDRSSALLIPRARPEHMGPKSGVIERLYEQDQTDRVPAPGHAPLDSQTIAKHDAERVKLIHQLYEAGKITDALDLYSAAVILQHGTMPEDFILAHDMAVLATSYGISRAKWLSAATEDRFLISIGRPQRFATQFGHGLNGCATRLCPTDPTVTDLHRKMLGVNTLSEARREAQHLAKI